MHPGINSIMFQEHNSFIKSWYQQLLSLQPIAQPYATASLNCYAAYPNYTEQDT